MDFCQLIHKAQKNDQSKNTKNSGGTRCYSTKFEPPKKEQKKAKDLSENIKKFLAKKEDEERQKAEDANKKKEELLALRAQDKKATRRVNVMLKRTKSANQAVIDDAVDKHNTSLTIDGPMQPDEDDYGYVSQESSALYNKMMEKYSKIPDEPKFDKFKKKVSTNVNSTRDRVKAALERERLEAMQPHKRKRKRKENGEEVDHSEIISQDENNTPEKSNPPPKPKPKPAPPPINFADLLKIAEKKQFEPVVIEQKPKDEEKLFTKKQKKELDREREWRERREGKLPPQKPVEKNSKNRIPKIGNNQTEKSIAPSTSREEKVLSKSVDKVKAPANSSSIRDKSLNSKPSSSSSKSTDGAALKKLPSINGKLNNSYPSKSGNDTSDIRNHLKNMDSRKKELLLKEARSRPTAESINNRDLQAKQKNTNLSKGSETKSKQFPPSELKSKVNDSPKMEIANKSKSLNNSKPRMADGRPKLSNDIRSKQYPPDVRPKQFPPPDVRPKQFPPADVRPRQFPPPDVKRCMKPQKKSSVGIKRGRILDDDDSEYDSEMDDFIDDGPEDENDYSSHIRDIFGYDKSRYRDYDDDVDNMESSFSQQMKEEVRSTKIGIMEDLEDIKKEEEQKRRKALMKKRKLK